jgi:hypothetical protein
MIREPDPFYSNPTAKPQDYPFTKPHSMKMELAETVHSANITIIEQGPCRLGK